jgi:hypothetical protein
MCLLFIQVIVSFEVLTAVSTKHRVYYVAYNI